MKRSLVLKAIVFLLLALAYASTSFGADTFTVTVPSGTEVTMGDPEAMLPLTVTNNSASKDIREITFTVDTAKYEISSSTSPPAGWCVRSVSTGSITLALEQGSGACSSGSTSSRISPGGSLLFNITALPLAAAADVTGDSLSGTSVSTQGGFSLSGALTTWTRRSLEASMTATPTSTGVGGVITLSMQVTNRSTASQSTISSTPGPPTPSSAIVTNTDGPFYGSTLTKGAHTASTSVITVDSTAEFSTSGTIKIDSEEICYTSKTATTLAGATRGCNGTTATSHSNNSVVYSLTADSLAVDETTTITWTYSADITGSVYFTARATNSAGTAKSVSADSLAVLIGDFTASLSLTPSSVISGQDVRVNMTVINNGGAALVNIAPSTLTGCGGGATETIVSGPTPLVISSLSSGSSGVFEWQYRITGSEGDVYCLSGSASANGPVTTNTTTSNAGTISNYSVTVTPSVVSSGAANKTLTWSVYNGSGCTVRDVDISTPASGSDWQCSSVTAPSGWSGSCGSTVSFSSGGGGNDIPSGGTAQFSITFSSTETVASDKVVSFPVTITARGCGGSSATIGSYVTVALYGLALTHTPAGPISADGSSFYTMTATLTSGGTPISGKTLSFTTTNGTLSPSSAVTDSSGEATVNLIAPNSTADTSAIVTATYLSALDTDTVNFTGWSGADLQYWGGLTPTSVDCGSTQSFEMSIRNISGTDMTIQQGSYFAFNDSSSGGSAVYQAFIQSSLLIPANTTVFPVTFNSETSAGEGLGVTVPVDFIAGTHQPTINSSPPPASGLFLTDGGTNDQYRTVTDNVTVTGSSCGEVTVDVIEWHEMR